MSAGIDLLHVRAGYGHVEALHDLTLSFPPGSVTALVGRNGAGKSTLLRVVAGTVPVTSGVVRWNRRDITTVPAHRRAAGGLMLVPDDPNVFTALSVAENLALFGGGVEFDAVYDVFPELAGKEDRRAGTLSGGERQMLALARVLLRPGSVIALDEVSRGLSAGAVARLYRALDALVTPARVIVLVEQYLPDIARRADLVYVLRRGELAWAGERSEVGHGPLPAELAELAELGAPR
jgi:branched-chain amino acid transport system ATP-binding protein